MIKSISKESLKKLSNISIPKLNGCINVVNSIIRIAILTPSSLAKKVKARGISDSKSNDISK
jgi:hypothetical protein